MVMLSQLLMSHDIHHLSLFVLFLHPRHILQSVHNTPPQPVAFPGFVSCSNALEMADPSRHSSMYGSEAMNLRTQIEDDDEDDDDVHHNHLYVPGSDFAPVAGGGGGGGGVDQLTLSFQGEVYVFDAVSPEKVQAVLLLLGGYEVPTGIPAPGMVPPNQRGLADFTGRSSQPQRAASLSRFREKRKERCFDKKIRYTVRKEVALRYSK
ncbi:GATA transcription factor 28 [Vitis vinifera]|uniref:GATA transcription factor 28 n=1 Tax=Vitis vinifera TaxID=29760 RepID=A0A438GMX0_VITVI|nr:GATA transcription factor 28 [Vitis vinifera]